MSAVPGRPDPSEVPGPPGATPGRRPLVHFAGDWGLVLVVALAMLFPVCLHLATRYVGWNDSHYWFWQQWRLGDLIRHGHVPWRIPDVVWPYGYDLRAADGFGPSMVGAAWATVVPNPVLSFNLAMLTALVTNAWAGRRLSRVVTDRRWVVNLGGLAFMTAPVLGVRVDMHYNLLFAAPAGLLIARALEVRLGRRRMRPLFDGALLALAYSSSGYYALYGAIVMVCILAFGVPGADVRRRLGRLAVAVLVAGAVASPLLIPKMRLERAERRAGATALSTTAAQWGADPLSVVMPPPGGMLPSPGYDADAYYRYRQEATSFLGIPLLAGLGAAAWMVVSKRRRGRAGELAPVLLGTMAVVWVLSLGTNLRINGYRPFGGDWLPATLLLHLPGTAGLRYPDRAAFFLVPLAVVLLALVLREVDLGAALRSRPALGVIGAVALASCLLIPVHVQQGSPAGPEVRAALRDWGRSHPDGVWMVLPDKCTFTIRDTRLQIDVRRPVVGCQGFTSALPFASGMATYRASKAWAALSCTPRTLEIDPPDSWATLTADVASVQALRTELGVGLVVFDRENACADHNAALLDVLRKGATLLADDGRYALFDLP